METREILNKSIEDHQKALNEAERELKKLEVTYSIGDRFRRDINEKWILAVGPDSKVVFVGMRRGCWANGSHKVECNTRITKSEFEAMSFRGLARYWDNRKGVKV